MKPLENLVVLEFCQYLAGPSAGLRLADLGARVIKIERPGTGDAGRKLSIKDFFVGEDSLLFQTINRHKESYAANLKSKADLQLVKKLIKKADVLTHNFRPGVMEKLGLGFDEVKQLNPRLVYGAITGYGNEGPWRSRPGQDLLIQSLSGLSWLSGNKDDAPTPFGLSIADLMGGMHLVQGILAALIRRAKTKKGALVEVNLLASLMDFQFEVITTFLNDGGKLPVRSKKGNAHAYLSAPYGVYKTKDNYMVVAMEKVNYLGQVLKNEKLSGYTNSKEWFSKRDEIMEILSEILQTKNTADWLAILGAAHIWSAPVLDYSQLVKEEGYKILKMDQQVSTSVSKFIRTTRCPVRIDGERIFSDVGAPDLGAHTALINEEFLLFG